MEDKMSELYYAMQMSGLVAFATVLVLCIAFLQWQKVRARRRKMLTRYFEIVVRNFQVESLQARALDARKEIDDLRALRREISWRPPFSDVELAIDGRLDLLWRKANEAAIKKIQDDIGESILELAETKVPWDQRGVEDYYARLRGIARDITKLIDKRQAFLDSSPIKGELLRTENNWRIVRGEEAATQEAQA